MLLGSLHYLSSLLVAHQNQREQIIARIKEKKSIAKIKEFNLNGRITQHYTNYKRFYKFYEFKARKLGEC